ncbi:RNA-guided endonuclease InsQ/TnpB family protein [Streptomyces sp. NPDC127051]|uniref:RNA-guided endonuclease InsQ/TnpB family protein n=1 Tax=Streptomyces sp. NPDC127051 TaxID=3347119 RepID=UPI00364A6D30
MTPAVTSRRRASGTGCSPRSSRTSGLSTPNVRAAGRSPASRPRFAGSTRRSPRSSAGSSPARHPATKDGDGCRWDSTPHDPQTRVRFQGVGHVKVKQHRPVVGKVKTVSVKREGKRWYVVLTAEQDRPEPLPKTGSVVGIDLGIANFLADSNGGFVPNPRHGRTAAAKHEAAQQALSRCKRRSKRRREAVERVATLHRKVRCQRLDHAHKIALDLVREHDFIAHEDLKIRNMSKAPTPKPGPETAGAFLPNGAAAKAGLNRSIMDAGWGVFLTILHAKAESAGREVIAVDPRNTSRTCPECGHVAKENRPTQEKFHCVSCGHRAHADVVGASNVLRAGLARRQAQPA